MSSLETAATCWRETANTEASPYWVKASHTHKHCFSSIKQAMAKFVHSQDEKMPALCACLRLGDFSHGKRKGVTLFLGEFFELHLSVDGTLSQGAERYK